MLTVVSSASGGGERFKEGITKSCFSGTLEGGETYCEGLGCAIGRGGLGGLVFLEKLEDERNTVGRFVVDYSLRGGGKYFRIC